MPFAIFILLGLGAGSVARGIFRSSGRSAIWDFGLGVAGAVIAGLVFNYFAAEAGMTARFSLVGALTSLVGATALLVAYYASFRNTTS